MFGRSLSSPDSSPPRSAGVELVRELGGVATALAACAAVWRWVETGRVDGLHGLVALALIVAPASTLAAVALVLRARQSPAARRLRRPDERTPTPVSIIPPR